jgi:phage major head subunit gpT-like protein
MEDNLYDTFAKLRAKGLARAMANTKQVKAADVFNNGFNSSFAGGDGKSFFASDHPTIGNGDQSNLLAASDLSEAALETALIAISKTKDDRGILVGAQAESLHIPSDLAFTADQILNSPLSTTIANNATNVNDINSIRNQGLVPNGFFVNRRFTDTNGYFIKTDVPNGAKMFVRSPLQTKMEPDFDTGNLRFKARERYAFGFSDWRGFFGSAGA